MKRSLAKQGGAAYPTFGAGDGHAEAGQSLRDCYAIAALPAVIIARDGALYGPENAERIARAAYAIADAMLAERQR